MSLNSKQECDTCGKSLVNLEIWTLGGLRYKCCSAACLLYIHDNPRIMTWDEWEKDNGSIYFED